MRKMIKRRSFTMMELLVAIAILALLSGVVGVSIPGYLERGRVGTAKAQIDVFKQAITTYQMDIGKYPESLEDLVMDTGNKNWRGPYLEVASIPEDPWGNAYQYVCPGEHGRFDVYSYGSDGMSGGEQYEADIGNW